jgi:hypothetical protein
MPAHPFTLIDDAHLVAPRMEMDDEKRVQSRTDMLQLLFVNALTEIALLNWHCPPTEVLPEACRCMTPDNENPLPSLATPRIERLDALVA